MRAVQKHPESNAMATPLIFKMPLELRLQIFSCLVTTPKNRIEFVDSGYRALSEDGGEPIPLSFLRTCKQIYTEAKNLMWENNTLYLRSVMHAHVPSGEGVIAGIANKFKDQVRSIHLGIDIIFDKTLEDRLILGHNLSILADWVTNGSLSSITLEMTTDSRACNFSINHLERILRYRSDPVKKLTYDEYIKELRLGTSPDSPLSNIKRRMIFNMRTPLFDDTPGAWQPKRHYRITRNPMDMFQELASAWGGRLEVDGLLAYENGNGVGDTLFYERTNPHQYYFKDYLHVWLMAEIVTEPTDETHRGNLIVERHLGQDLLNLDRQSRDAYFHNFEPQLEALKAKHGIRRLDGPDFTPSTA